MKSFKSPEVPKGTFRDCKQSPRSRASPDFGSSSIQKKTINFLCEINCLSYHLCFFFFWRGHVGIEPTRDFFFKPHTGFEDQETHQSPFCPQNHSDHTLMQFFLLDPGLFHQSDDLRPVLKSGAPCQSAAGRDHPRNQIGRAHV